MFPRQVYNVIIYVIRCHVKDTYHLHCNSTAQVRPEMKLYLICTTQQKMKATNVDFCVWTPRLFNSVCHHNVLWPNLPSMLYAAVTIDIDFEEKTSIFPPFNWNAKYICGSAREFANILFAAMIKAFAISVAIDLVMCVIASCSLRPSNAPM